MTKDEAIKAMRDGHKVAHEYFSNDEWMAVEEGKCVFEDGCRCEPERFWEIRTEDCWLEGWKIYGQ